MQKLSEHIQQAFRAIKREDFVRPDTKPQAEVEEPLPIGFGQTISQPFTVAFMFEKLQPKTGQNILDIGSGSGWTTALLAFLVGQEGKVVGIEVLPELAEFGKKNVAKYNFIERGIAQVICANGAEGYAKEAPYEGILVSASLAKKEFPPAWKKQLAIGGTLVVPIQNSIWVFTKTSETQFQEKEYPGFIFVPFVLFG